jgi:hypothetical protein
MTETLLTVPVVNIGNNSIKFQVKEVLAQAALSYVRRMAFSMDNSSMIELFVCYDLKDCSIGIIRIDIFVGSRSYLFQTH